MKKAHMMTIGMLAMGGLAGCNQGNTLSVTGGEPVSYHCEQGKKVQVRYFSLSDESLSFIKLSLCRTVRITPCPRLSRPPVPSIQTSTKPSGRTRGMKAFSSCGIRLASGRPPTTTANNNKRDPGQAGFSVYDRGSVDLDLDLEAAGHLDRNGIRVALCRAVADPQEGR